MAQLCFDCHDDQDCGCLANKLEKILWMWVMSINVQNIERNSKQLGIKQEKRHENREKGIFDIQSRISFSLSIVEGLIWATLMDRNAMVSKILHLLAPYSILWRQSLETGHSKGMPCDCSSSSLPHSHTDFIFYGKRWTNLHRVWIKINSFDIKKPGLKRQLLRKVLEKARCQPLGDTDSFSLWITDLNPLGNLEESWKMLSSETLTTSPHM